jgi:protein gp37
MAANSSIEWTDNTWNPCTGCTKISPGCNNCYAERMAKRLQAMGAENYRKGFELTLQPHMLQIPLHWKKPRIIFVNSMSDLFHEDVPIDYIKSVFKIMEQAHWHHFQVLTKRAERLVKLSNELTWPSNVWIGVSVENVKYTHRIDLLRKVPAKLRFLSIEPLLGPIASLDLSQIHWVIVGGESGPKSRPIKREWVIQIRDDCVRQRVPFFFKQWGGVNKKRAGRLLDGQLWDQIPIAKLSQQISRTGQSSARAT